MWLMKRILAAMTAFLLSGSVATAQPEAFDWYHAETDWRFTTSRKEANQAENRRFFMKERELDLNAEEAATKLTMAKEQARKILWPFSDWQIDEARKQYVKEMKEIAAEKQENIRLHNGTRAIIRKYTFPGPGDQFAGTHQTAPHDGYLPVRMSKGGLQVQIPTGQWFPGSLVVRGVYRVQLGGEYRTVKWQNGRWVRVRGGVR